MEQRKLPNATIALVLGIISFIACCLSLGIGGVILSGIALYLANRDRKKYFEAPEEYSNYNQVKAARVIAIIGLILAIIVLAYMIFTILNAGGWDAYMHKIQSAIERAQAQQQQ